MKHTVYCIIGVILFSCINCKRITFPDTYGGAQVTDQILKTRLREKAVHPYWPLYARETSEEYHKKQEQAEQEKKHFREELGLPPEIKKGEFTKLNLTLSEMKGIEIGSFTDSRDYHEYNWVLIGNQIWMAENLAYLPSVSPSSSESYTSPYNYVYGYQGTSVSEAKATSNYSTYGVLYNWPAAIQSCPDGWHLPDDAEWKQLEMYLGMSQSEANNSGWRGTSEGGKLKETGTAHWNSPKTGTTNESSFTALPGGYRSSLGYFYNIGYYGFWWSSTEYSSTYTRARILLYYTGNVHRFTYCKEGGFSVRCVRDE